MRTTYIHDQYFDKKTHTTESYKGYVLIERIARTSMGSYIELHVQKDNKTIAGFFDYDGWNALAQEAKQYIDNLINYSGAKNDVCIK